MLLRLEIEDRSDTIWWKYKCTQQKINGSTSFTIDNTCYVSFRIQEQESVTWCVEIQKPKMKSTWELLIFTPIPLDAQEV